MEYVELHLTSGDDEVAVKLAVKKVSIAGRISKMALGHRADWCLAGSGWIASRRAVHGLLPVHTADR